VPTVDSVIDHGDVYYSYSLLYETNPHVRGLYNICVVQVVLFLVCVVIRDSYTAGRLVLAASGVRTPGFLGSLVLRSFHPDPVFYKLLCSV